MKTLPLSACLTVGAAVVSLGCGRKPETAGPAPSAPAAVSAPSPPPPVQGPSASLPGLVLAPPAASGAPTPAVVEQFHAAALQMQARFDAGQRPLAEAYARDLAAWKAKQLAREKALRAYEAASLALQKQMADPTLTPAQRNALANATLPAVPDSTPPPVEPLGGDPQANQSFDALIYKFRQAVSARNHGQVLSVMAQMAELAPRISPALMGIYQGEVKAYAASFPTVDPSPAAQVSAPAAP